MKYIKPQHQVLQNKASKAYTAFLDSLLMLFAVIAICLFSFSYFYVDVKVLGPSMQPTINAEWSTQEDHKQDTAYIRVGSDYQRGDIIVVEKDEVFLIKRLIAKGGDTLNIVEYEQTQEINLYLNGEVLQEDYVVYKDGLAFTLAKFELLRQNKSELFEQDNLVVPQGYVFYLGDNRGQSVDSSSYGPVPEGKVVGSVDLIVPYNQSFISYIWQEFIALF